MAYKDKDKQKQAQRDWVRQRRAEQKGSTTIMDAVGNEHLIDFEGRCKDFDLLKDWHAGKGTVYQQALGELARKYSVINGYLEKKAYKLLPQGRAYLGGVQ